jgi:hypothetical protein
MIRHLRRPCQLKMQIGVLAPPILLPLLALLAYNAAYNDHERKQDL